MGRETWKWVISFHRGQDSDRDRRAFGELKGAVTLLGKKILGKTCLNRVLDEQKVADEVRWRQGDVLGGHSSADAHREKRPLRMQVWGCRQVGAV